MHTRRKVEGVLNSKKWTKLWVKVNKEVLPDVSARFYCVEEYIKERIEEICALEKMFVEEVIYFLLYLFAFSLMKACVFNVMVCCLFALSIKNSYFLGFKEIYKA